MLGAVIYRLEGKCTTSRTDSVLRMFATVKCGNNPKCPMTRNGFESVIEYPYWGGGTWVAQSVELLTSAQVMISQFVSLGPTSGPVLTARSLESGSDCVCVSLRSSPNSRSISVSLSKVNKY